MPFPEIKKILNEIANLIYDWQDTYTVSLSPSLSITGGEPLLRPDLPLIIDASVQKGFEVYILSNGTLISGEMAKTFAALGTKGVQVSIEGPEKIHDSIRGTGSFRSAINGVRNLLEAGIIVTLNATLSRLNAGFFMDMVGLASSLGVHMLGFSRLVPSGRGAGLIDKMLDIGEVKNLYEKIHSISAGPLKIVSGDPLFGQMDCPGDTVTGAVMTGGCAAGLSGFTILADGTITPCRRLPVPIGNIRRDSLREIWATSPVLEQLRDRTGYKGKCGTCPRWASCRGCRAIAYAYARGKNNMDYLSEDPQCFIDRSF
jgi:radical SAM protein with 4Fe4S-binding SPASM domain